MNPNIIAVGEPLLEFNALKPGRLKDNLQYDVGYGGDTSNFSIAASRSGGQVGYITRIGDDDFGHLFLDLWRLEGIDTSQVVCEKNGQTGIYFISRIGDDHHFTYYRKGSAASRLSVSDIPEQYIAKARVLHTSGISQAISTSACEAVLHAIGLAKSAHILVSYDPNIRPRLWGLAKAREIVWESIRSADIILPSLDDAVFLTGLKDPYAIIDKMRSYSQGVIALKLGGDGVLLSDQNAITRIDPIQMNVVDTTGAGDAFDGAFIAAYVQGYALIRCAEYANAAAALTTTAQGAGNPIPTREKIDQFMQTMASHRDEER